MKVFLRIPTNGHIDRELTRWLMWLSFQDGTGNEWWDMNADIHYSNFGPAEARNEITEAFLSTDCSHLWMVDHDVVPPRNLGLLAHDRPVVCGLYKAWKGTKAYHQVYMPTLRRRAHGPPWMWAGYMLRRATPCVSPPQGRDVC